MGKMEKTITDAMDALAKKRIKEDIKNLVFDNYKELEEFLISTNEVTKKSMKKIIEKESSLETI